VSCLTHAGVYDSQSVGFCVAAASTWIEAQAEDLGHEGIGTIGQPYRVRTITLGMDE